MGRRPTAGRLARKNTAEKLSMYILICQKFGGRLRIGFYGVEMVSEFR